MPQQTINIGAAPDDGTGDTLRVGGDKINDNFTELYAADAALGTAAALDVDTDDTLAADSDSLIPTQQAVKAYVDANVGSGGIDVEDEGVSEATGATTLNFVGAGVTAADAGGGVVDITIPGGGVSDLDDLSDVDLTGAATGDVLTKDAGGDWVAAAPSGGSGGLLYSSFSAGGTPAATTETDLQTYTVPANTMANNGEILKIRASGSMAATTRSRTIKLYIGTLSFTVIGPTTTNTHVLWYVDAQAIRTASNGVRTWRVSAVAASSTGVLATNFNTEDGTPDWTSTAVVKVTGTVGGAPVANDIICNNFTIEHAAA